MIKAFFPDIGKLKVEDIDLANPKVEKNGNDVQADDYGLQQDPRQGQRQVRQADEFFKSIGFDDPKDSPLEVTSKSRCCSKSRTASSTSPTAPTSRTSPAKRSQRHGDAFPQ